MRILIGGGIVVTSENLFPADVYISEGKILDVVPSGKDAAPFAREDADSIIDASGQLLMPGGVDPHVHMHLPTAAGFSSDNFLTGSRAALYGGTTTLIDFVTPLKGQSLPDALEKRREEAANALTDCFFHVSPVEWRNSMPDEITACVQEGVRSFKVYMAYKDSIGLDDVRLGKVMQAVARAGGLLTVHCEDGDRVEALRNQYYKRGFRGPSAHPLSRPPDTESQAVEKAIKMAARFACPLYIVHVSCWESVSLIRDARAKGQEVYGEACPHHLLLDESLYLGDFREAAPYVMSPPLRGQTHREALWEGLADGSLQTIGTDHCPFMMEQKERGLGDFRKIANGVGGVEHRLSLIHTYGVLKNRISLSRFVDAVSVQPARIFGLAPSKGSLHQGADADIIVWNTRKEEVISAETHHQHCDHNIYEGISVTGMPSQVIVKGKPFLA
jgi:dihydropyrimidinase